VKLGFEKDLLHTLPKTIRNLNERMNAKSPKIVAVSRNFDYDYFDGDRKFGYGGYVYDGRWLTIAKKLIQEYSLSSGMKVLDIGCAKGFLVKDLMITCPGLEVYGLDISEYALLNAEPEVIGRLHLGNAISLPFPDNSFDLVISINTLHNLERGQIISAICEIERVKKNNSYVVVDSYRNSLEKEIFQQWVLTAKFHDYPQGWIELFKEAGYTGDYHWTIIEQTGENE
jgi:ubiquinone/menaquinone biosynthesis C-methylase UbiE